VKKAKNVVMIWNAKKKRGRGSIVIWQLLLKAMDVASLKAFARNQKGHRSCLKLNHNVF